MTDTSPAVELRAAADKLRQLATAPGLAPGPWRIHNRGGYPEAIYAEGSDVIHAETTDELDEPKVTAPYIAAMHPGVGKLLADWLDAAADMATAYPEMAHDHDRPACDDYACDLMGRSIAAARAVLGQQPHQGGQAPPQEPHSAPRDLVAARVSETSSGGRTGDRGVTHACPPDGSGLMPCCGRPPFEAPRTDRITTDPDAVTCRPAPAGLPDWIRKGTRSPGHPVCKTSPKGASKAAPDNGWSAERHAGHGSPCETSPNGSCAEAATDDGLREQYAAAIIAGGGCVDLKAATDAVVSVRDRHMEQLAAGRDELATAGAALAGVRELASRWRYQQDRRSAREELLAALNITRLADPAHALTCTARDREGHLYVLDDRSRSMGADVWGTEVCQLAIERQADAIVVETNYGGDMARQNVVQAWQQLEREGLTNGKLMPRIITVNAKQGKRLRGGEPQ